MRFKNGFKTILKPVFSVVRVSARRPKDHGFDLGQGDVPGRGTGGRQPLDVCVCVSPSFSPPPLPPF